MDKRQILEKARKTIEGFSRHQIHKWKLEVILAWINVFHWSTPSIIDYLAYNTCKRGFARLLLKKGLLIEKKVYPSWPWMPRKLLVLSKYGRETLNMLKPNAQAWTGKIAMGHIFHDYLTQFYVAKLTKKNGGIFNIISAYINAALNKTYDAILVPKKKEIIGIEIEISRKKIHEVSNMLANIALDEIGIKTKEGNTIRVNEVHIVYLNDTIKNQFTQLIHKSIDKNQICKFYIYKRNSTGKYEKQDEYVSIPYSQLKIKFVKLDIPPKLCEKHPKQPQQEKEEDEYTIEL